MKKIRIMTFILIICLCFGLFAGTALADPAELLPELDAQAAFVGDLSTGKCVWSLNADEPREPASLTKLMTALLAAEAVESGRVSLDEMVTVQDEAMSGVEADSNKADLIPGEIMRFEDLYYCMLLGSANDACNVIAIHIAGSIENFVAMMNARAADLGCSGTHFVNTHGMPDDEHYSTAEDLFEIFAEDMKHELFVKVASTAKYTASPTNNSHARLLSNTNALINASSVYGGSYLYEPAICGKTGHTNNAGYCLASAAEKDGLRLCTVVLGCGGEADKTGSKYYNFLDSAALYDWAFDNFSYRTLIGANEKIGEIPVAMGKEDSVSYATDSEVTLLLPNDTDTAAIEKRTEFSSETFTAPISAGQILGKISYIDSEGNVIASTKLVAENAVQMSGSSLVMKKLGEFLSQTWLLILLVTILLIVVIYAILAIRYSHRRRKLMKQRAAARRK